MSISIEHPNGRRLAEARRIGVHGLPGVGGYTLVVNLHLSVFPPGSDTYLRDLAVRVDWGDNQQRMIGTGAPDQAQPVRISKYDNEKLLCFRMLLSPSQIEAIEALRNGGDINLSIWISGSVFQDGSTSSIQQQGAFTVRQQEWIEVLERMDYRRTFLYELPLPFDENGTEPTAALLRKAQYHLMRGHYDECVGECRKLLEACPLSEPDQRVLKTGRDKYKGDRTARESMDVPERMLVLRDALAHATHLAHHHSSSDGYSRDQARAIFGVTISLLSGFTPYMG